MAFEDGAGSASWAGFRWTGDGAADVVSVIPLSPLDGNHIPSTTVPLAVNVSNSAGGGTDLQYQVATDSAFASIISSPSPTTVANGLWSSNATGLTANVPLYWRVRGAPAGTTGWGPWSVTSPFIVDVNAGKAIEYVFENIGGSTALYAGDSEYVVDNIGAEVALYAGIREYSSQNIGILVAVKAEDYEYVWEGDVSTNEPTPHVWFLWKPYGFVGDEVWAYGHGFGNPQSEYTGHLKLRLGPGYLPASDVEPVVTEWYLQEVTAGAYTADRIIYAGTGVAPPHTNQQVEVVRWVVPTGALPTEPTYHHVYVTHGTKTSNMAPWLMYPTIPVASAVVERNVTTSSFMRLAVPEDTELAIPQALMAYAPAPYMISGGRAERMPLLSASATTDAVLSAFSTQEALADALTVDLGATRRWLPDATKVVAHSELGTGVSLWVPSVGSTAASWRFEAASAPFINPAYEIETRLGTKTVPAMIFPGDAWAKLSANLASGPTFTIAIVAVLQAPPKGRGYVLSTFANGTPDSGSTNMSLQLEGSALHLFSGGKLANNDLQRLSRRPVVIVAAVDGKTAFLRVVDLQPQSSRTTHPMMTVANSGLWMGRSDQVGDLMYPIAMDVLEVAHWNTALAPTAIWALANKLDGIYGVTQ